MKRCHKCKSLLEYESFGSDRSRADRLSVVCKTCGKAKSLAYYYANRAAILASYKTPEFKATRKKRTSKPEYKLKQKIYRCTRWEPKNDDPTPEAPQCRP